MDHQINWHHLSRPSNLVRPALPLTRAQCFNYDVNYRYLRFRVEVTPESIALIDLTEFDDWPPPSYCFSQTDQRFLRFLATVTRATKLWQMRSAGYRALSQKITRFRRRTRVPGYDFSPSDKVVLQEFLHYLEPNHLRRYVEVALPHPCYNGLIMPPCGEPLGDECWGTKQMAEGGSAKRLRYGENLWRFTKYGESDSWIWINLENTLGEIQAVPLLPSAPLDPRLFAPKKLMFRWA